MASNKAALKSRIKSINATKKITHAMNLISNVKLQKERNKLGKISLYSHELIGVANDVFANEIEIESIYLKNNDIKERFILYFGSDLGMCGAYNSNAVKYLFENSSKDDYLYVLGTHSYNKIKNEGYNILNDITNSDNLEYIDLKMIADEALDMYLNDKVGGIDIIYTEFVNTLTFVPRKLELLPFKNIENNVESRFIYLEPDPKKIIEDIIILLVRNTFFNKYIESKTSEQASRRLAMENATDNANELVEKLKLEFNQARQAQITQEITEIISGADSL